MVNKLGYPLETLSVEKGLDQMFHLDQQPSTVPNRRADIICFAKDIHPDHSLYPLLLIECKSVKLNSKARGQVIGYNRFVRAYYIALANEDEIETGWFDPSLNGYQFCNGLPEYSSLRERVKLKS